MPRASRPDLREHSTAGAAMRQRARQGRTDAVRSLGQVAELRIRERRQRRGERADVGEPGMPLRDMTEQHEPPLPGLAAPWPPRAAHRSVPHATKSFASRSGTALPDSAAAAATTPASAAVSSPSGASTNTWLEVILVGGRIHERYLRAFHRGLADPMCDDRHLHPQIRADNDNPLQPLEVRDRATELRCDRIRRLVAEVPPAQAVIDVVATEMARDAAQEIQLLERCVRRGEHAERVAVLRSGSAQCIARSVQGVLPATLRPTPRSSSPSAPSNDRRCRSRGSRSGRDRRSRSR